MREHKLPSGAILKIGLPPFAVSKALYQAVLEEAKLLPITAGTDLASLLKDILCFGFSSKRIEECLWECFKRATYNCGKGDLKIDADTFESAEARADYLIVCLEVAEENIRPFAKSLSAVLSRLSGLMPGDRK